MIAIIYTFTYFRTMLCTFYGDVIIFSFSLWMDEVIFQNDQLSFRKSFSAYYIEAVSLIWTFKPDDNMKSQAELLLEKFIPFLLFGPVTMTHKSFTNLHFIYFFCFTFLFVNLWRCKLPSVFIRTMSLLWVLPIAALNYTLCQCQFIKNREQVQSKPRMGIILHQVCDCGAGIHYLTSLGSGDLHPFFQTSRATTYL